MFEPTTIIRRSERQVACNLNGEVAILDLDKGLYFGLQEVGAHVWNALEKPRSINEIYATVLAHFDVTPDVCRADVLKFLRDLQKAGMISIVSP
jgi:hypothetical protein